MRAVAQHIADAGLVLPLFLWHRCGMSVPDEKLIAATPEDLEWTLTHALQFDGRKHFKSSSEYMAKITAAHLAECLRKSGFVIMKRPLAQPAPGCAYAESVARVKAASGTD